MFASLTLRWLKALGGVAAIEKINTEKAAMLYKEIDENDLFTTTVEKQDRSKDECMLYNER